MKIILFSLLSGLYLDSFGQTFKTQQLAYDRVQTAYTEKWENLATLITAKGFDAKKFEIFIRIFKLEQKLEVWISNADKEKFILLKEYPIVTSSGKLGPKRQEGDLQVPEGFYEIDRFNPISNFYLSLGINYPNKSDQVKGKENLGGDIFIHGSNVTIGCVPITDDKIKELYALSVQAKSSGQKNIYVHIFPFEFKNNLIDNYTTNENYLFWQVLAKGYNSFNQNKLIPSVKIDKKGDYLIN